jgi:hypothetical protein
MRGIELIPTFVICAALFACGGAVTDEAGVERPEGFEILLDGTSVDGWNAIGDANWSVGEGYVEATSGAGFLVTPASYANFELHAEFWVNDIANSGIFIRCSDPAAINAENSYEVNIYDTRPDQTYRTGSIVDISPPASVILTGGQWNTFEITADGPRLRVTLNGIETVDVEDDLYANGPIGLQYGGGIVRFRNVRIRVL